MRPNEFNEYLCKFDNILIFPAYMKRINAATFKIGEYMIEDYLKMYGKDSPCISYKRLYNYNNKRNITILIIEKLHDHEFLCEDNDILITPNAFLYLLSLIGNKKIISQYNFVYLYEGMYNKYLSMKNQ